MVLLVAALVGRGLGGERGDVEQVAPSVLQVLGRPRLQGEDPQLLDVRPLADPALFYPIDQCHGLLQHPVTDNFSLRTRGLR
eukprot:7664701-Pyramimonas_sp.AAC.1